MSLDAPINTTIQIWGEPEPLCAYVKIMQILGEVRCYLQPGHDGAHCSSEWMEWQ